ncbi:MAG TPA: hypothetical protein VIS52_09145 [Motiliproteus sp.]
MQPLAVLLLVWLVAMPNSHAESSRLLQCQRIKDQIAKVTDQRRAGGSATQMRRWQQQRNHYRQRYGELDCKTLREVLK